MSSSPADTEQTGQAEQAGQAGQTGQTRQAGQKKGEGREDHERAAAERAPGPPGPSEPPEPLVPSASRRRLPWLTVLGIAVAAALVCLVSLSVGRYSVPVGEVARMLVNRVVPLDRTWYEQEESVVFEVRMPRVVLSFLVGSALACAGAVLQSVFRNPLVSPQVLGVSAGASFGGVLSMVLGLGSAGLVGGAFLFGLGALVCVVLFSRIVSSAPLLMIVLGGVVISALFSALTSLMTYVADPYRDLPAITFWLLGSLATAGWGNVVTALPPILVGAVVVLLLRWRLNILALGDDDARALGVPPAPYRNVLLLAVALLTAAAIAVSGVIGWVGLLVPHLSRLMVGSDNRVLLPASLLLGGGYLTVVDTLARTLTSVEIPLGILTAIIGAPFFVILLARFRKRVWLSD